MSRESLRPVGELCRSRTEGWRTPAEQCAGHPEFRSGAGGDRSRQARGRRGTGIARRSQPALGAVRVNGGPCQHDRVAPEAELCRVKAIGGDEQWEDGEVRCESDACQPILTDCSARPASATHPDADASGSLANASALLANASAPLVNAIPLSRRSSQGRREPRRSPKVDSSAPSGNNGPAADCCGSGFTE
jgi:hypothetical protein